MTSIGRKNRSERLGISVTPEVRKRLEAIKRNQGIPVNEFVNRAIKEKLESLKVKEEK